MCQIETCNCQVFRKLISNFSYLFQIDSVASLESGAAKDHPEERLDKLDDDESEFGQHSKV